MNLSTDAYQETRKIEAYKVSQHARMGTLPRHFGPHMTTVEGAIYDLLRQFAPSYEGGLWDLFELSNGGFMMTTPPATYRLTIPSNGYAGEMSAEAAGITVCLFCFSLLSFEHQESEVFSRHFHWLRGFALGHVEAAEIFAAIN